MGLRDIGEALPPGFRFYPSDEELVCHYLYKKIANEEVHRGTLVEIDLHICEPWMLPDVAKLNSNEWYFFSFRDRKYATGFRTNRATTSGYWKATGKDRAIFDPRARVVVGMRKTLVFYKNRAPNGIKTGWIMHEFRLENPHVPPKEDWVLCRVFYKSRSAPGEENSNKIVFLPHDHDFHEPTAVATSPNLSVCPTNNNASQHVYCQNLITPFSNDHNIRPTVPESGYVPNLQGSIGIEKQTVDTIGAKCEDDFGYLLDFCGPIELGLADMEFEDDHGSILM